MAIVLTICFIHLPANLVFYIPQGPTYDFSFYVEKFHNDWEDKGMPMPALGAPTQASTWNQLKKEHMATIMDFEVSVVFGSHISPLVLGSGTRTSIVKRSN